MIPKTWLILSGELLWKKITAENLPSDKPSYKLFRASLIFYFLSVIRKVSSDPLLITTQA